ncbi:MAG TPA: ornithine cyclodeaminase family protein [bacterium]|nr:ornithine cyclodeaminase family protein [bacterium]
MLFLSNRDIQSVLDMRGCLAALTRGYEDADRGDAAFIPRIDLYAPTGRTEDYYRWGSMTGACRSYGVLACRLKSDILTWPGGRTVEKYCVRPGLYSGIVLLYALADGRPLALMHDGYLQHMRTGGSAGLGADALARRDARVAAIVGSGGMARTYLEAIAAVRPLEAVRVYSPTPAHRERFAAEMSERIGAGVTAVSSARDAVAGADIVATATDALQPTFEPEWLAPGAHATCVTRREVNDRLLARATVVVQLGMDSIPAGTPVPGMEWPRGGIAAFIAGTPADRARIPRGGREPMHAHASLADLRSGRHPGRTSPHDITFFVNSGTQGLQFAAVGGYVLEQARGRGLGTEIPDDWFLEDIRD